MAFELGEIREHVASLLKDGAGFTTQPEQSIAIDTAIRHLNRDKPLQIIRDIAGDGTQDYALPSDFVRNFSDNLKVETPAGENPPRFREEDDDWFIYEDPTQSASVQLRLRFKLSQPSSSDLLTSLDVDTIVFQANNVVRYTFNGSPDLSTIIRGNTLTIVTATNSSNNGNFDVNAVNDGSDFVDVINPDRFDATDDEATDSPAVGTLRDAELIRLTLNTEHTVTETISTLSPNDFLGVVYRALNELFSSLAAQFTQSTDPTIPGVTTDFGARGLNYRDLANDYIKKYRQIVGLDGMVRAAQAASEADLVFSHGEDFFWRSRRER